MANVQGNEVVTLAFVDNVRAEVGVKLIDGDEENPANVYGRITIRFRIGNEFVLFDTKKHQHIPVRPGQFIPLIVQDLKVLLPSTNFEITAYLKDYDKISYDDGIANDNATFLVKASGTSDVRFIYGKYGSVEVSIFWS